MDAKDDEDGPVLKDTCMFLSEPLPEAVLKAPSGEVPSRLLSAASRFDPGPEGPKLPY